MPADQSESDNISVQVIKCMGAAASDIARSLSLALPMFFIIGSVLVYLIGGRSVIDRPPFLEAVVISGLGIGALLFILRGRFLRWVDTHTESVLFAFYGCYAALGLGLISMIWLPLWQALLGMAAWCVLTMFSIAFHTAEAKRRGRQKQAKRTRQGDQRE